MPLSLVEARLGARLLAGLPAFLRHPVSAPAARAVVRRRLDRREADFLAVLRDAVYPHPGSPYRRLLARAGCEPGDLERLVGGEGVEGACRALAREGVHLTFDELKGRRAVVRGSLSFRVEPAALWNPTTARLLVGWSSGSRSARFPVPIDLASVADQALDLRLWLEARGDAADRHGVWLVPGGGAMAHLLTLARCGIRGVRWFSQVDPAATGLHPRYRWADRLLRWGGLVAGVPLPAAEHVPVDDPRPVAEWLRATLRAGQTPHLWTFASSAVRLVLAARRAGIDLRGARATVSGEPVTEVRMDVLREAGLDARARCGAIECGLIGVGCLTPAVADDLHLLTDLHAIVEAPGEAPGARGALLVTSLRPTARLILLNASLGDQATIETRPCGCPLGAVGWTTHLARIRSREKVTAGGMTFPDAVLERAIEEILPARFGGGPTHYQLVEGGGLDGRSRLRLVVHPAVGPVEPAAVVEAFLSAIAPGVDAERVMALAWRDGGLLDVERRPPATTASGKILHCHVIHAEGGPAAAGPLGE